MRRLESITKRFPFKYARKMHRTRNTKTGRPFWKRNEDLGWLPSPAICKSEEKDSLQMTFYWNPHLFSCNSLCTRLGNPITTHKITYFSIRFHKQAYQMSMTGPSVDIAALSRIVGLLVVEPTGHLSWMAWSKRSVSIGIIFLSQCLGTKKSVRKLVI